MFRMILLGVAGLGLLLAGAPEARAQSGAPPDWSPPSREMPAMPLMAELDANWRGAAGAWSGGVEQVSGVASAKIRAAGEAGRGGDRAQLVRFASGPLPVALWTDRNGDERADMIELFRGGAVVIQLIDADYDGNANVMRILDASGALIREQRM